MAQAAPVRPARAPNFSWPRLPAPSGPGTLGLPAPTAVPQITHQPWIRMPGTQPGWPALPAPQAGPGTAMVPYGQGAGLPATTTPPRNPFVQQPQLTGQPAPQLTYSRPMPGPTAPTAPLNPPSPTPPSVTKFGNPQGLRSTAESGLSLQNAPRSQAPPSTPGKPLGGGGRPTDVAPFSRGQKAVQGLKKGAGKALGIATIPLMMKWAKDSVSDAARSIYDYAADQPYQPGSAVQPNQAYSGMAQDQPYGLTSAGNPGMVDRLVAQAGPNYAPIVAQQPPLAQDYPDPYANALAVPQQAPFQQVSMTSPVSAGANLGRAPWEISSYVNAGMGDQGVMTPQTLPAGAAQGLAGLQQAPATAAPAMPQQQQPNPFTPQFYPGQNQWDTSDNWLQNATGQPPLKNPLYPQMGRQEAPDPAFEEAIITHWNRMVDRNRFNQEMGRPFSEETQQAGFDAERAAAMSRPGQLMAAHAPIYASNRQEFQTPEPLAPMSPLQFAQSGGVAGGGQPETELETWKRMAAPYRQQAMDRANMDARNATIAEGMKNSGRQEGTFAGTWDEYKQAMAAHRDALARGEQVDAPAMWQSSATPATFEGFSRAQFENAGTSMAQAMQPRSERLGTNGDPDKFAAHQAAAKELRNQAAVSDAAVRKELLTAKRQGREISPFEARMNVKLANKEQLTDQELLMVGGDKAWPFTQVGQQQQRQGALSSALEAYSNAIAGLPENTPIPPEWVAAMNSILEQLLSGGQAAAPNPLEAPTDKRQRIASQFGIPQDVAFSEPNSPPPPAAPFQPSGAQSIPKKVEEEQRKRARRALEEAYAG